MYELLPLYKVLLPEWVFKTGTDKEVEENAIEYLKRCYPEREFIKVDGKFALCRLKNCKI
ncbi:hypothetical protein ACFSCZ_00585 [Siminovitchia sediminis]|uniref:Uncharacterized protein n=1 Tax=Siminovitchia sediminis TaxID=1274353 RepID=A0ABW4KAN0_9BACI